MMLAIERLAHRLLLSEKCIMNSLFLPIISIDNQMMSCDNSNLFTFEQLGTHTHTHLMQRVNRLSIDDQHSLIKQR